MLQFLPPSLLATCPRLSNWVRNHNWSCCKDRIDWHFSYKSCVWSLVSDPRVPKLCKTNLKLNFFSILSFKHSIRAIWHRRVICQNFFGPFQPQDQSNTLNHIFAMISKSNIYYRWYTENWSCMRAHARGERHKNRWLDCVIMMRAHLTELRPEPSFWPICPLLTTCSELPSSSSLCRCAGDCSPLCNNKCLTRTMYETCSTWVWRAYHWSLIHQHMFTAMSFVHFFAFFQFRKNRKNGRGGWWRCSRQRW